MRADHAAPPEVQRSGVVHLIPFPFDQLFTPIARRVRAEGVSSCSDWIRLGRRRKQIFGVVTRDVERIDELVRKVMLAAYADRYAAD